MAIEAQREDSPLILHVDDEEGILRLVSLILSRGGFRVASTVDTHDALAMAGDLRPDLILVDIMHPNMSGLDLLAQLKANAQVSDIPVVMLTANGAANTRNEAMQMGAVDYLVKPCNPNQLIQAVESHLDGAKSQLQG